MRSIFDSDDIISEPFLDAPCDPCEAKSEEASVHFGAELVDAGDANATGLVSRDLDFQSFLTRKV